LTTWVNLSPFGFCQKTQMIVAKMDKILVASFHLTLSHRDALNSQAPKVVAMTTQSHTYIIAMKVFITNGTILNLYDNFFHKIGRFGYRNWVGKSDTTSFQF
jgi:dipeptide/tripeptide permease